MAGLSKTQLIDWLKEGPKTLDWGAILAFNRTDTNTVLLQEYIQRFSTNNYLPPVQGYIGDSDTVGQYISDYTLDFPRLSFEIANVDKDSADAKLTMQVVGGTHVTFKAVPGGREATRVEVVDPLNGPELSLDLQLVDVPGTVTRAGQVVLDLKRSSNFSLSYSDHLREQRLGGEFFQQLFEALPDAKRVMVISEISKPANSTIKPDSIKLRTQAAPGAKLRNADNYGDGAVLVFVAMQGQTSGGNPDASFKYLIPNDRDKNYSATLLLGNRFLLDTLAEELLGRDYIGTGAWTYSISNETRFWAMNPDGGRLPASSYTFRWGEHSYNSGSFDPPFNWQRDQGQYVHFQIKDGAIRVDYQRNSTNYCCVARCWADAGPMDAGVYAVIDAKVSRAYRLNTTSQVIEPDPAVATPGQLQLGIASDFSNHNQAVTLFNQERAAYTAQNLEDLQFYFPKFLSYVPPIDTFALHSLLFRNTDAVVLDDIALPGDMALFGWVGPSLTKFKVKPLQPLVGTGESLEFSIEPLGAPQVTWSVHNILGSDENPGNISSAGRYTAPATIKGAFLRVRVTATAGSYSSSALVSVVVNDITVSPLVQTCDGGHSRTLAAGTRSGTLSWSLKTPANGGRLEALEDGKYKYTAPTAVGDKEFIVEELVVLNQATGKTKSAWIMVPLVNLPLAVQRDSSVSLPANQTRLLLKSGAHTIPDAEVQWQVVAGVGSISNGIFTTPATLAQRFALVLGSATAWGQTQYGFTLLPLPLFDYPQTRSSGLVFMDV
ncbi:putative uncharacterized protein [Pseudomonas sp. StFLB209]|uniref:hypothetical protein n=1 Tax=Pseudomonas sp. StFLB209 TaxID=1028989 RepID=UPI0004F5B3AC|nr:hypothetical protein [Pseudomonas sp. StFLB209]BAP44569.1 putative uncharacterized protein [Pseudomonas sp. StFLB209]